MAAHQAPPSLGFFRQEHRSGLSHQERRDTHTNLKLRGYLVNTPSHFTLLPPWLLGLFPDEAQGAESQETCRWVHAGGDQIWMGTVICTVSRNKHPFSSGTHCDCLRRRQWQPTPVFLPEESQGRGSLVSCRLWGCTESDTTGATQQQQQQQGLSLHCVLHI